MDGVFPWHTQDKVTKGQGFKSPALIQSFLWEVIKKKKKSPIKTEMGLCKLELSILSQKLFNKVA